MLGRLLLHVCVIFFLISAMLISTLSLAIEQSVNIKPPADWVLQRQIDLHSDAPLNDLSDGTYYRLLDSQIKIDQAGERSQYSRFVETVVNKAGLEKSSQLNFYYDPSYQEFVLHHLFIYRNGKKIDKLNTAKISIFSQENDLKTQIYHGDLTVNILLDDLREGDTLDYSFSRLGSNPVYNNIFSYDRNLTWAVPVNHQFIRVLWGKDKPLYVNTRNISPHIQKIKRQNYLEYQVAVHNEQHVQLASQTPQWYDPYGHIYFSETADWQSVIQWASPLYNIQKLHPDIQAIAKNIEKITTDKKQQISKALAYAQNEIRYVGLEMGTNSHFPTPAHETVALRYGDCKDKALLLIAILSALDITAYPALVNTDDTKLLAEIPPGLHYFDHVIVTLEHDGKRYWLDPTMSYQQGLLDNIFQPDFAYALILNENSTNLTSMSATKVNSFSQIIEKYVLSDDPQASAKFSVESRFLGNKAQRKFNQIAQDGVKALTEAYEIYYQSYYSKLKSLAEVTIEPNIYSGILTLREHYEINNIWTKVDGGYEIDFYPQDIREAIYKPKQVVRNSPLAFNYPNNINNTIVLIFTEDGWDFDSKNVSEDNAFFSYHSKVNFDNNTLTLTYDFQAKTDHIPADKIDDYLAARKRVMADAYYGIIKYFEEESLLDKLNNYVETQATKQLIEDKLEISTDNTIVIKASDKVIENRNKSPEVEGVVNFSRTESEQASDSENTDEIIKLKNSEQLAKANKNKIADYWPLVFIIFYLFAYLFILVNWRINSKASALKDDFYCVSLFKFMCLSVTSFGLYNHYWLYRNWQQIKAKQQLNVMPFYRAIFALIWFYPLYLTLKKDSNNKYQKNLVCRPSIALFFTLLYSVLIFLSVYLELFYSLLILASTGFLFIPLVDYIEQQSTLTQHEQRVNNTWQFRHSLLVLLFCPLILISAAQHYYLLPKNQIVEGSYLKASDIKFLKQNGLLPIKDYLAYFYSDAWLSIKNAGVGFSESLVFSYGYNIDGNFFKNIIPFKDISKIEVDFAQSDSAYTSLLITKKSGDKLVFIISAQKQQDKTFVKRLKAHWQAIYFIQ